MVSGRVSTNNFATARFIVDTNGISTGATHSTITAALADATSGQTIFIRPGTYTENLTLKAGVNLCAYDCDAANATVVISGTCTATFTGAVAISGVTLQTNSATFLTVSGSNATSVGLVNCFLNCTNNTGISYTSSSSSSSITVDKCFVLIGTTGITIHSMSSSGNLSYLFTSLINPGLTTTAASNSAGAVQFKNCRSFLPVSTSSTGLLTIANSSLEFIAAATMITANGTGGGYAVNCYITSSSSSAISIGTGVTFLVANCNINSSNTNVITGLGTLQYAGLTFSGSSSGINVTTQTVQNEGQSKTIGSSNSGNTNALTVTNSSNTATSEAAIVATVGGTSSADARFTATVAGSSSWSWGLDNSDTDAWTLSGGTALGTNNVIHVTSNGEINYPLQPAFLVIKNAGQTNVTGDGTNVTVTWQTEIYDSNADFASNTFTAPVTGHYQLSTTLFLQGLTASHTSMNFLLATSNRNYYTFGSPGAMRSSANELSLSTNTLADMDAADTSTVQLLIAGGTLVVDIEQAGATDPRTWFCGQLLS